MSRTSTARLGALMSVSIAALTIAVFVTLSPAVAHAHVSLISGPGFANATQEITFGVGHGCAGADTFRVRVQIPESVTAARPMTSGFGKTSVEKNDAGLITAVIWQKAEADVLPADLEYYKLTVRIKVPNAPFTTLYFPAEQSCRSADGTVSVVNWSMLPGDPVSTDGSADEPAPTLAILPPHLPGWNKFTAAAPLTAADLKAQFADALIVWKGTAAFSANPATADLISVTAGVTALTAVATSDVLWVKY